MQTFRTEPMAACTPARQARSVFATGARRCCCRDAYDGRLRVAVPRLQEGSSLALQKENHMQTLRTKAMADGTPVAAARSAFATRARRFCCRDTYNRGDVVVRFVFPVLAIAVGNICRGILCWRLYHSFSVLACFKG